MDITSITPRLTTTALEHDAAGGKQDDPAKIAKASQQFEGILLRQILGESLKPMMEHGPGSQVYSYFLTDSLANSIGNAGGLGLGHVLQTQLTKGKHDH
jgi:Rod binding domain-containing protein